jgi:hypothetical protein
MTARILTRLKPIGAFSYPSSLQRVLAQLSEHKQAGNTDPRQPTERWRDKRPQGAARSVGCFCLRFSLIRQCAASAFNVRAIINTLPTISFPHIAEAGDG